MVTLKIILFIPKCSERYRDMIEAADSVLSMKDAAVKVET